MRIHLQRAFAALALFTIGVSPVRAADFEHIRLESPLLEKPFTAAFDGSPTFRSIVQRIESSDVIAHVTCGYFRSSLIAGRTMLAAAVPDVRYVRVQILCDLSPLALAAIVAHELQHVAEIASEPAVIDDNSFERLYRKIGSPTCLSPEPGQFETPAAVEAGHRVRGEIRQHASPGVQARQRIEVPVAR